MKRLGNGLEVASNIAVALVSVVVLSVGAISILRRPAVPTFSTGLEKGKALGRVAKVDYDSSEQTLLIALRTTCTYCQDSLPLYRKLANPETRGPQALNVVAIFPERSDEVEAYLKANQLDIDYVAQADFRSLNISGTPTMILVDRKGAVKDFWLGKLESAEAD